CPPPYTTLLRSAIVRTVTLAVATRPGSDHSVPADLRDFLSALGRHLVRIPFEPIAISATDIREQLAFGNAPSSALDPAVFAYIKNNRLYDSDAGPENTV